MKLDTRQVKAKQGLQWIISGFYLFGRVPAVWLLLCFTMVLIAMTLALIPPIGTFLFTLISPVFLAGIMQGCKDLELGQKLSLSHLFVGFKQRTVPLITIGGIYLIGQVLIIGIARLIGGSEASDLLLYGKRVDDSQIMHVADNLLSALLAVITLSIPLMMAAWFSPLLVFFHNMPPIPAMKKSFFACIMNFIPFQVYGIILIILTFLGTIPYGLGLIIIIPTIFASIYVSYKDIFLAEPIIMKDNSIQENIPPVNWSDTKHPDQNKADNDKQSEQDPVQCTYCGTHMPEQEAVKIGDEYYCSNEHYHQHQSKTK